jgi:hypothetical protein
MTARLHITSSSMMGRACCWLGIALVAIAMSPERWMTAVWASTYYCSLPMDPQPTTDQTGCNICEEWGSGPVWVVRNGQDVQIVPYKKCAMSTNDHFCIGNPYSGYVTPTCSKTSTSCGNMANMYEDSGCTIGWVEYPQLSLCTRSFLMSGSGTTFGGSSGKCVPELK